MERVYGGIVPHGIFLILNATNTSKTKFKDLYVVLPWTEREGRTGECYLKVMAVPTERSEVRTKTTNSPRSVAQPS